MSEGIVRSLAHDPIKLDERRKRMLVVRSSDKAKAGRRRAALESQIWLKGNEVQPAGSPSRMKAGAKASATKLAWCPPNLRADYLFLTGQKRLKAAEARLMIEEQNELDMARWRRSIGEVAEEIAAEINDLAMILNPIERVMVHAARLFDMEVADITCRNRRRELMIPRYAVALALQRSGVALLRIGQALNRPDHATARNSAIQGAEKVERDPEFAAKVQALQETFAMAPAKIRRAA